VANQHDADRLLADLPHITSCKIRRRPSPANSLSGAADRGPTDGRSSVPRLPVGLVAGLAGHGPRHERRDRKLEPVVSQVLQFARDQEAYGAQGADWSGDTPQQFVAFIRDEKVRLAKIVKVRRHQGRMTVPCNASRCEHRVFFAQIELTPYARHR